MTETAALGAENTPDGVKARVRTKSGEQTLEARKAIAADGTGSSIVESLSLNEKRQVLSMPRRGKGTVVYILEGVETEYRLNSWLNFTIPDLSRGDFFMWMMAGDRNRVGTAELGDISPVEAIDKFMKLPAFAPWFRHARVVGKVATAGGAEHVTLPPIREPVVGKVLITSDAGRIEATNPGAIACGYQAAKATLKELNGQKGYPEYTNWWLKSFAGFIPVYKKSAARFMALNVVCSDGEVDYIHSVLQGQVGIPTDLVGQNLEQIKAERPELYQKLKRTGIDKSLDEQELNASDVFGKK